MHQNKLGRATSAASIKTNKRNIKSRNKNANNDLTKINFRPSTQNFVSYLDKSENTHSKLISEITLRENENLKRMSIFNNLFAGNHLSIENNWRAKTAPKFKERTINDEELTNAFQRIRRAQKYTKNDMVLIEGIENEIYLSKEVKHYMKIASLNKISPASLRLLGKFNQLTIYYSEYISRPNNEYLELSFHQNRKLYIYPAEKRHRIFYQQFLYFAISSDIDVELSFIITFRGENKQNKIETAASKIMEQQTEKPIETYKQISKTIKHLISNKDILEDFLQKVKEIKKKRAQKLLLRSKSINFISKNIIESRNSVSLNSRRMLLANTRDSRINSAKRLSYQIERDKLRTQAIKINKWKIKKKIEEIVNFEKLQKSKRIVYFLTWIIIIKILNYLMILYKIFRRLKLKMIKDLKEKVAASLILIKWKNNKFKISNYIKNRAIVTIKQTFVCSYISYKFNIETSKIKLLTDIIQIVEQKNSMKFSVQNYLNKIKKIQERYKKILKVRESRFEILINYWDRAVMEICKKLGSKSKIKIKKIHSINSTEKLKFLTNYVKDKRDNFRQNFKFFLQNKYYLINEDKSLLGQRRKLKKERSVKTLKNLKNLKESQTLKPDIQKKVTVTSKKIDPKNKNVVKAGTFENEKSLKEVKKEGKMLEIKTDIPKFTLFPSKTAMIRLIFELAGIH